MPDPKLPGDDRDDDKIRDGEIERRQPRPLHDVRVREDGRRPTTGDGYEPDRVQPAPKDEPDERRR